MFYDRCIILLPHVIVSVIVKVAVGLQKTNITVLMIAERRKGMYTHVEGTLLI